MPNKRKLDEKYKRSKSVTCNFSPKDREEIEARAIGIGTYAGTWCADIVRAKLREMREKQK